MISGYLHNFVDPAYVTPHLSLSQLGGDWDEVIVAFADVSTDGVVSLAPGLVAPPGVELALELARLKAADVHVALSIGGADAGLSLNQRQQRNFVASMNALLDEYPFDGLDFDLEARCDLCDPGNARNVRDAILKIASGSDVRIIFTPEWPAVQGGLIRLSGYWGSQLWMLNELRDVIDSVRVQYYNNCDMSTPYSRRDVKAGSTAQLVQGSRMLLDGFPLESGGWFKGLRPRQIGLAVAASQLAVCTGYSEARDVLSAVGEIHALLCSADSSVESVELAVWSINWDAAERRTFSTELRRGANALEELTLTA